MSNNQFKKGELYSFITGKASTAIGRRLQKNFKQANIEITIEQWSVLYHLWKQDGLSQQQLCDATFRDKPSITRLVDNLEKLKLVKRVASKDDRRINLIYITKEAGQLQLQTMELANQTLNESLEGVTIAQIDIAKVQMFYFTVIAVVCFFAMVFRVLVTGTSDLGQLPLLPDGLVAVLGISHAGYLTSKSVSHTKTQS